MSNYAPRQFDLLLFGVRVGVWVSNGSKRNPDTFTFPVSFVNTSWLILHSFGAMHISYRRTDRQTDTVLTAIDENAAKRRLY